MDQNIAIEVGRVVRKVMAINWRDMGGGRVDFIRVCVIVDMTKPSRRVACVVDKRGNEITYFLKYERLPIFCYICELIGHGTKKCSLEAQMDNLASYHFGRWMRVKLVPIGQGEGNMGNGVEIVNNEVEQEITENQEVSIEKRENRANDGVYVKSSEEASASYSPTSKRPLLCLKENETKNKRKRKKSRGLNDGVDGSPIHVV